MTAVTNDEQVAEGFLRVVGLSKAYGDVRAVSNVSFSLEPGTFFALLGPSGCGKTTLLKMLAGFESPSAGEIHLGPGEITDMPAFRRPLNTVFQHYALFPHMDVAKNVGYALRQQRPRIAKSEIESRVNAALQLVQLDHLPRRRPSELSGGQQQRVALARALVAHPSVLLLDEPLSALDAKLRVDMQAELKSLQSRLGISFIFVTHDQGEALSMADRIAVMREGEIVQDTTPMDLYDRPADSWVAGFIGTMNFVAGTVAGVSDDLTQVETEAGTFSGIATADLNSGQDVRLALRPERLRLFAPDSDDSKAAECTATGVVEAFSFHGDQVDCTVRTQTIGAVKVRIPLAGTAHEIDFQSGGAVVVGWNSRDARVVPTWNSAAKS
ncbi:ABC transporter ATP-binding protein [Nonomuraea harbinensis]|uniref:ABC transporter ATP-binding protein n=1 Tax=Nonomuraea harbinensis TaxID=1286938 RepID=A0ABW1BY00_9ACTN|nr:ABC transporter ATP-binding protein [Nonomuraea harbinensis]